VTLAVQGYHDIEDEIYISLPVVVGEAGISSVFNQKLAEDERSKIQKSAKTLREVLDGVKLLETTARFAPGVRP